jgi:hypothetical protein
MRRGGDIQRPNQILQCVAATVIPMAKGISEATTIPIPIVLSLRANLPSASFRMGDRDILDQESDQIDAGIQHHPDSKAHKAALKVA